MTHYRALGYVERAATREDGPIRVVLCTEGRQADGIDLRMSGAQLDRFRSNPVLGYGHIYWGRTNLPIGRVIAESIKVDGKRILGELEFDPADMFAMECERKMRGGFLNAVSIGFEVTRWEDPKSNYWTGGVAETWELHELSVVPVPMDPKAVVESGRGLADPQLLDAIRKVPAAEFEPLLARLRAIAQATQLPESPAEPTPEISVPAVPAIDTEAARDLLAAFNLKGNA